MTSVTKSMTSVTTEEPFSSSFVIPLPLEITYYVIGSTCVIGNFLTIVVIVLTMDITKTLTNSLILNQSIIDFFCGVFLILTTAIVDPTRPVVSFSDFIYCKVWLTKGPLWGCFTSSSFNLVTITLERLIAIKFPIWYKISMTRSKVVAASLMVWLLGMVVMVGYGAISTAVIDGQCNVYVTNPELGYPVVSLQFFLPIMIFIVVYSQIAFTLRKRVGPQTADQDLSHIRRSRNIIMTLVKVVLCFVFCWSWNQVYYFLYLLKLVKMDFEGNFYHFTVVAVFCNCCCNPIVYTLSYKKFKVGALKLLGCAQQAAGNSSSSHRGDNTAISLERSR